jgi:dihydropteroate synthase
MQQRPKTSVKTAPEETVLPASPQRPTPLWRCKGRALSLATPLVMGILNVTPDSFSDGGRHLSTACALEHALAMIDAGADIIDVGGESTRPGAQPLTEAEELGRILPVIQHLAQKSAIPISVDTRHAAVARQALAAGAHIVNNVACFTGDVAMACAVREAAAGLVIMHSRGTPQTMMSLATYDDVVSTVEAELLQALAFAQEQGISREACVLDPGLGFAKNTEQNVRLLASVNRLRALGPLLIGASHKRFIGELCHQPDPAQRLSGSLCASVWSVLQGASILRVHDVRETKECLAVALALQAVHTNEKQAC